MQRRVNGRQTDITPEAVLRAALIGLLVYGTYDLTNMATLRHWSLRLALVDIAWGTLVSAAAGAAAFAATRP